jgi:hypothetical protein
MKKLTIAICVVLLCAPALLAQMPMSGDQKPMTMPDCAAMMQKEKGMQQHMTEMNNKLQALVDSMNKAKGSERTDRMAAVINELVAQRSMMMKEMMEMQPEMMQHMMAHMHSGMMSGMQSMANCPMMKSQTPAAKTPEEHKH